MHHIGHALLERFGKLSTRGHGVVGEIAEHAVHAQFEVLLVFNGWIAIFGGGEVFGIAAEGKRHHLQALLVGAFDHIGGF